MSGDVKIVHTDNGSLAFQVCPYITAVSCGRIVIAQDIQAGYKIFYISTIAFRKGTLFNAMDKFCQGNRTDAHMTSMGIEGIQEFLRAALHHIHYHIGIQHVFQHLERLPFRLFLRGPFCDEIIRDAFVRWMKEGIPAVVHWFYDTSVANHSHRDSLYIFRESGIRRKTDSLGSVIFKDRSYVHETSLP
jgi:hypothetical protein